MAFTHFLIVNCNSYFSIFMIKDRCLEKIQLTFLLQANPGGYLYKLLFKISLYIPRCFMGDLCLFSLPMSNQHTNCKEIMVLYIRW